MRFERNFAIRQLSQCLRLDGKLLAALPSAPLLPVAQTHLFAAQEFDALSELGIDWITFQRLIDDR